MKGLTGNALRVYLKFPSIVRSSKWDDIKAKSEIDLDLAMSMAQEVEDKNPVYRAENVVARRLWIQRASLFILQKRAQEQLEGIFKTASDPLVDYVAKHATRVGGIPPIIKRLHKSAMLMRRQLTKWATDHIWFAARLSFRNMGDALQPIFDDNVEAFREDIAEAALVEERLSIGISSTLAARGAAKVALGSPKWSKVLDKIYAGLVATNARGLKPSERVWELTRQVEARLKATLVNDIAAGVPSATISRKFKSYLSPAILRGDEELGAGIYKSPFRNAMRLVRTETNRAYSTASAEWAKGKEWVEGMRLTLSPSHKGPDECDDLATAGKLYTPEEIQNVIPVHPHCMCQATPVIKSKYLALRNEED